MKTPSHKEQIHQMQLNGNFVDELVMLSPDELDEALLIAEKRAKKQTGNYIHITEVESRVKAENERMRIEIQKIGIDLSPIKGRKKHNNAVMKICNSIIPSAITNHKQTP